MFEMPDFIVICLTSVLGLMYATQPQLRLVFCGKVLLHGVHKGHCAMERYKVSQVITGYTGCAQFYAHTEIMDTCGKKRGLSCNVPEAGKSSSFPR